MSVGRHCNDAYGVESRIEVVRAIPLSVSRLLDVGCGEGGFGKALQLHRADIETVAVEPDPESVEVAKPNYERIVHGSLQDNFDEVCHVDCVTFNDVLEHLEDPWATLEEVRDRLSATGTVVASIPNIRYIPVAGALLFRGQWKYVDRGTLDRTHLRFFTRESIVEMFQSTGFEIRAITGINPVGGRRWAWTKLLPGTLADVRWLQYVVVAGKAP